MNQLYVIWVELIFFYIFHLVKVHMFHFCSIGSGIDVLMPERITLPECPKPVKIRMRQVLLQVT